MTRDKRQLRAEAVEWLDKLTRSGELTVRNEASDDELFRCSYCHCEVRNIDMTEGDCGYGLTFCPQCGGEIDEGDSRRIEAKLSERDEWKAKAEHDGVKRSMTNLERLYGSDEFFNHFTRWYVTDGGKADDDVEADEWLMAEHEDDGTETAESVRQADLPDADGGQNADMSESAPDCVRNDVSTSENGVSDGADGDKRNFDPENLVAVPRDLWAVIAKRGIAYHDRESLETAMNVARLGRAVYAAECRPRVCGKCGREFQARYPRQRTCDECLGR